MIRRDPVMQGGEIAVAHRPNRRVRSHPRVESTWGGLAFACRFGIIAAEVCVEASPFKNRPGGCAPSPPMSAMSSTQNAPPPRLSFHPNAYRFLQAALERTQEKLGRGASPGFEEDQAHISGVELLQGIRDFGLDQFGLMTKTVFNQWGLHTTDDFGKLVFEMIDRGDLRKTENDQLSDFNAVYDFDEALNRNYRIDTRQAF